MKDAQTIFTIFYGIYFAITVTLTGKFQPFDTPTMYRLKLIAWVRFVVSFLLLNILPLLYFVWIFHILRKVSNFYPSFFNMLGLLMFSLAGFGFYRVYFGVMLIKIKNKYLFYGEKGLPYTLEKEIDQRSNSLSKSHEQWHAHVIPGIIWASVCFIWGYLSIF